MKDDRFQYQMIWLAVMYSASVGVFFGRSRDVRAFSGISWSRRGHRVHHQLKAHEDRLVALPG